ncbi:MAG: FAD-dependent oxidoreductase [Actinomycetota bacterium]
MDDLDRPSSATSSGPNPRLLILGGGFAGVWSALSAARTAAALDVPVRIQLVNPDRRFVPRPRLYEAAPGETTRDLRDILEPLGVAHVEARAAKVDAAEQAVALVDRDGAQQRVRYDRLILATGSQLVRPPIDGTHLHDIDTLSGAEALDRRLHELPDGATVVVVGAGFTGIELACELPSRFASARVVLLERSDAIGSGLGPATHPHIESALDRLNVDVRTGTSITGFDGGVVRLADGTSFPADVVVWTAGMRANPLTESISSSVDRLGRLAVDQFLRVRDVPFVFAAGDTAAPLDSSGHTVQQSAQHAIPQGACAGGNAVADLVGAELTELATLPYGTCLDLGAAGAVFTEGWDREVRLVGDEAKALKTDINRVWIYPPMATSST